jgi:hypothetical protein
MKVFVGWAYEQTWIDDYVIPLMRSYGIEVSTGKELEGRKITDGVMEEIAQADAAIFFTTRRTQEPNGSWKTSEWVVQEIGHANSLKKERIWELREQGVEYPSQLHEQRQYFVFEPEEYLKCLVKLGETLSQWRTRRFRLKLLPEEFVNTARLRIKQRRYRCTYAIQRQGQILQATKEVLISREGPGFMIYDDVPAHFFDYPDAFIEVSIDVGDTWSSAGTQLSIIEATLEKL